MAFNVNDMVLRPATSSDYAGVLAISKGIYDGRDVLPAMYDYYMKDKTRISYVAEYHGKIVSVDYYIIQIVIAYNIISNIRHMYADTFNLGY